LLISNIFNPAIYMLKYIVNNNLLTLKHIHTDNFPTLTDVTV